MGQVLGAALALRCGRPRSRRASSRAARPAIPTGSSRTVTASPPSSSAIFGGFIVGLTSVGSGVFFGLTLLVIFPLRAHKVVGTDIFHAAVLLYVAGAAHWAAGNIDFAILGWLLLGSIPGVLDRRAADARRSRSSVFASCSPECSGSRGSSCSTCRAPARSSSSRCRPAWSRSSSGSRATAGSASSAVATRRCAVRRSNSSIASRCDAHGLGELRHDRPRLPRGGCRRRGGDRRRRHAARARSTRTAPASARSTRSRRVSARRCTRRADINADETLEAVGALEPELIFVVGWSQLVRDPFIALAREGVFGMHPTLLPRHRGRAPIPWAILTRARAHGRDALRDRRRDRGLRRDRRPGRRRHRARRDGDHAVRADRGGARRRSSREFVPQLLARTAPRIAAGSEPRELLAEAHAGRRDHRLGDARAVPLRLGSRPDAAVSRRVHVPR